MKPVFEKVPMGIGESLHCEVVKGRDYGTRWHFHPEHQLTLAVRSQGHRLVGDHLGALEDGDVVLVGSNVPHVWHQKACRSADFHSRHGEKTSEVSQNHPAIENLYKLNGASTGEVR